MDSTIRGEPFALDRLTSIEERLTTLTLRVEQLEQRVDVLAKGLDVLEDRVDALTVRVGGVEAGLLTLSGRVDDLADDMRQRFRVVNDRLTQLAA